MSKENQHWIVTVVAFASILCTALITMNVLERRQQAEREKRMLEIEENHKAIWMACASIIDAGSACALGYIVQNIFTNQVPMVSLNEVKNESN